MYTKKIFTTVSSASFVSVLFLILFFSYVLIPVSTAYAASASVQSLSPSNQVAPGNSVSFSVSSSGFSSSVTYTISDSQNTTTVSNSNINSAGVFSWIPTTSDVGTHTITITVTDQANNTVQTSTQITVINPTVSIASISPSTTVNVGQTIFINTLVSGLSNPTYTISDSLVTSSLYSNNINSAGNISWTPKNQDVGSHTITITAQDSAGHSANTTQSVTVGELATTSISLLSPGVTLSPGQTLTFTVTQKGFTNPVYSISDSFLGTGSSAGTISSTGQATWTPRAADVGTHTLTITTSDSLGNIAQIPLIITVQKTSITIQNVTPAGTINTGNTVTFSATTTGYTSPQFTVSDSFSGSSITSSNINSSGAFSWTPLTSDIGTHMITVRAYDGSGNMGTVLVQLSVTTGTQTQSVQNTVTVQTNSIQKTQKTIYTFTKALSLGSKNNDVTMLQKILTELGFYSGPITGYFGPATGSAVKKFQIAHKLSPVGTVGPGTRAALNNK